MIAPAVVCRGVTKEFGAGQTRTWALRGVDMEVQPGELTLLVGPSGCGKTTLISIIAGLLNPTAGQVTVLGEDLTRLRNGGLVRFRQRHIGFVFQQYNLFPALTALENVEYALNVKGRKGRRAHEEAASALTRVGLGDRLHFLPRDLSGGQKQRVAIARALAGSPPVILADEPTANLDTAAGTQVPELFRDLAKSESRGLVIVTHDPKVRAVADRVVGIRDGRLAA